MLLYKKHIDQKQKLTKFMKLQNESWAKSNEKQTKFEEKTKEDFAKVEATAKEQKEAHEKVMEELVRPT